MFGPLQDLYNLRKQAAEMQKMLATEKVTGQSKNGSFSITLNGSHELLEVNVSERINLNRPEIEKNIKEAFEDAQNKLKTLLAEKFHGLL